MEWKDVPRRTYYEKYERVEVENHFEWFEVYRLPGNVYAIAEPQHFQEVNLYLITGSEKAVLLDTGMGIHPVKPLIEELYSGEVMAINSHFHFDHIGNNHAFEPVYNYADEYVRHIAETGLRRADVGNQLDADMFKKGYPKGFNPDTFKVPPFRYITVEDGQIFNLGDRRLKVIHTPGHSHDSIMLYDETNQILFTGDTFYMGALYAHFNCDQFGHSDIKEYYTTMDKLSREIPKNVKLYCSHNEFVVPSTKLKETAVVLKTILDADVKESGDVNKGHQYLEKENALEECVGDGFSVVYTVEKNC